MARETVRYTFSTPASKPKNKNSIVSQGAVPNQPSSRRPNHQPSAMATTKERKAALSSPAVRIMRASELRKKVIDGVSRRLEVVIFVPFVAS